MFADPDFTPFEPPAQPLGLRDLPMVFRNYLETIPRSAYEEGVTTFGRVRNDVILITKPELIGEVLVEKHEAFRRDPVTRRAFAPAIGGNSLFLAEDAEWRWQRRAVAPVFRHETHKPKPVARVTLRPAGGMPLLISPRRHKLGHRPARAVTTAASSWKIFNVEPRGLPQSHHFLRLLDKHSYETDV